MVNFKRIQLRQADLKRLRDMFPRMLAAIDREGGILPQEDVIRVWGKDMVDLALADEVLTRANLSKKDPPIRRAAVYTKAWNKEKPAWL